MNAILVALIALSGTRPDPTPIPVVSPTTMFRGGPAHVGVYEGGGRALTGLAWRAVTRRRRRVVARDRQRNGVRRQ